MAASKTFLKIQGWIDVKFSINYKSIMYRVLVADNLPHNILLGVDFLESQQVSINFWSKTLHLINEAIPLTMYHIPSIAGQLQEAIIVPKEHACIVWVNAYYQFRLVYLSGRTGGHKQC